MPHERAGESAESERKKLDRTEAQRKAEIARELAFRKEKEAFLAELEGKKQLEFLRSLVERGMVSVEAARSVASGTELSSAEVARIFAKIDEIEAVKDIDRILPPEFRLTREQYLAATRDAEGRAAALATLDRALGFLFEQTYPGGVSPLGTFFQFLSLLNRNLVLVQENTVDIKRSLS